jgi:hypothetical protein
VQSAVAFLEVALRAMPVQVTHVLTVRGSCNARRQRGLKGRSPDVVLRERLAAKPELADLHAKPPDPRTLARALRVVPNAKEVSHPDTFLVAGHPPATGFTSTPRIPRRGEITPCNSLKAAAGRCDAR